MKKTKDCSLLIGSRKYEIHAMDVIVKFGLLLKNAGGWIIPNKKGNKFFAQNGNDLGNCDLYDVADEKVHIVGRIIIPKLWNNPIYILEADDLTESNFQFHSLDSAIADLEKCYA